MRQTRGKKGPRKTRKQGKRKGGKTRKRVMGKRGKRTMRKVRGGTSESGFGQGVEVWDIKYDIINNMKVHDWKRFWKKEDRAAFEQIMIRQKFAKKGADDVVYLIHTPRMVPYAIEEKYLENKEVKEFLESLEGRYLDSLEEDLNEEEEEEGTGVHEPVEEIKGAERKGYMRRLREKLFRIKRG